MKNFKKKFLSAMLACLMLSPCAAGFASCDNGGNGGGNGENTEPTYGDWQFNDTEHWRERTVYDEEERGEHTYGADGYTCTVRKRGEKARAKAKRGGRFRRRESELFARKYYRRGRHGKKF